MANDSAGKKSLAAMAAILGASIGMNAAVTDAHGIAAPDGVSDPAEAARSSPMLLVQEINLRPGGFESGRSTNPRSSSQLKFQKWAPSQLKFQKQAPAQFKNSSQAPTRPSAAGSSNMTMGRSMNIMKTPAPPAPFVPIPYPNIGASQVTSKTPTANKTLTIRKR